MSVTCPHCSGEVDEDFGLVECPHCNQQFMVSVDGDVELGSELNNENIEQPEAEQGFLASDQMFDINDSVLQSHDEASGDASVDEPEEQSADQNDDASSARFSDEIFAGAESSDEEYPEDQIKVPEMVPSPVETTSANISKLANEGESAVQESSPYVYSILIKGIDTADIRRDLKDTLTDMRLRIDVDAIINSIAQGEVTIENISSVKAALIVQRLRVLPIELSWRQRRV